MNESKAYDAVESAFGPPAWMLFVAACASAVMSLAWMVFA